MANQNLKAAKQAKRDEFYTQLPDIENELRHYQDYFREKTVLCNCDDPRISNFFRYFALKFDDLGLKRVIAMCYKNTNPDLFTQNLEDRAVYLVYDAPLNGHRLPDLSEIDLQYLKTDGDFRNPESIEILKQADIVVTNPPFSLFREYITQLVEYEKSFLVVGNINAITYKEIFKLIKENKVWLGYGFNGGNAYFEVPDDYSNSQIMVRNGKRVVKSRNCCWFTNLDIKKRHEELFLSKKYIPEEYPSYDNYDAIEVSRLDDIPVDYTGVMGVPVTFLDKYNPEQFELLGNGGCYAPDGYSLVSELFVKGVKKFKRLLIRNRKPSKGLY